MNIIGIGIDICKNARVEKILNDFGERFLHKVFHSKEIEICNLRYSDNHKMLVNFLAKRFAAKEAFVKALGFGFNGIIKKNEIAILNDEILKKPYIIIFDSTKEYIERKFGSSLEYFVSMSDEKEFSVANVVITKVQ
jgi:holo-[acyl-carrier protein] synthase